MRKQLLPALRFALLALLTLGLFSCPTGLDYPLTEKPDKPHHLKNRLEAS
jgi:hypothetical protein